MANFRDFWKSFTFKSRVTATGPLSADAKRDFYSGIDAFALPSTCDSFGLVLLEAWANAKANIAYGCGGPGELIRDGVDGLLAATGDIADLSAKLQLMIENESMRTTFGCGGRISRTFSTASPVLAWD